LPTPGGHGFALMAEGFRVVVSDRPDRTRSSYGQRPPPHWAGPSDYKVCVTSVSAQAVGSGRLAAADGPSMSPCHPITHCGRRTEIDGFSILNPSRRQMVPCGFVLGGTREFGHGPTFRGKPPEFFSRVHWDILPNSDIVSDLCLDFGGIDHIAPPFRAPAGVVQFELAIAPRRRAFHLECGCKPPLFGAAACTADATHAARGSSASAPIRSAWRTRRGSCRRVRPRAAQLGKMH
jgi:hypothetical protein